MKGVKGWRRNGKENTEAITGHKAATRLPTLRYPRVPRFVRIHDLNSIGFYPDGIPLAIQSLSTEENTYTPSL